VVFARDHRIHSSVSVLAICMLSSLLEFSVRSVYPMDAGTAARRKGGNPNKAPDVLAEKKAAKAERDALRKRAEEIRKASWKYGLGAAGVIIGKCGCERGVFLSGNHR
jgi:hypothetical protein